MKVRIYLKNRQVILVIFGLVLIVAGLLATKFFYVYVGEADISYVPPRVEQPVALHKPVYLRTGEVIFIKGQGFDFRTARLDGSDKENIKVIVGPTTAIIEIQVPNFITRELDEILQNGGQVIKRVPVEFSKIQAGQTVSVLSLVDMRDLKEINASRVEYQKFFDPPIK
ncbi:MAG: hypothetical protein WC621_02110 [Patescibacteria group bacterium]